MDGDGGPEVSEEELSAGERRWSRTVAERSTRAHGRRTLVRVLEAAEAEFAAHGWHGARMARMAKRAGTAHGTVYSYFADKDDLLFAMWQDVGVELNATMQAMPPLGADPDSLAALRDWVGQVCACFRRNAAVSHAVAEALTDEESLRGGKEAMRQQRDVLRVWEQRIRDTGSPGLDPAMAALAMYAMLEGANESVYRDELLLSEDELVVGLSEFIERSLFGASTGSARLAGPA